MAALPYMHWILLIIAAIFEIGWPLGFKLSETHREHFWLWIPHANPKKVDTAKCISCMKCVSVCPKGARRIGLVMNFLATQALKKVCATRKENELHL